MKLFVMLLLVAFTYACGQKIDDTFQKPMYFPQGIYIGTDPLLHLTWPTGGGSMVYPAAGIPLSTGTAWGVSIANNSANWNTAFGWGNHAGLYSLVNHNHSTLYKPLSYVPTWAEITGKPTFDGSWATLTGKPTVFNPDLTVTNPLYRPATWKPDYETDVINKPPAMQLDLAISQIKGVKPHGYTTAQINALVMTAAEEGM